MPTKTPDDILGEYEKKHGLKLGTPKRVTGLPTGNLAIDWQSGVGGIPVGRITELYGYESSGKTTTALQTAAQLQRRIIREGTGQRIIYLDYEHALDVDYASQLGIDFTHSSFMPLQPNSLEQGGAAALDLIETGQVPLVVFDSVAAMAPKRLKEGEFDQATVQMLRAKLISALCSSMIDILWENDATAIFVNHKMEAIEMSGRPGMPARITTPGGRGLKYYSSLRLEFDLAGGVKEKLDDFLTGEEANQLVGNKVNVKCVKNKVGIPGRTVEVRSRFGMGFDDAWSAFAVLLSRKHIVKSGSWFKFPVAKVPTLTEQDMQLQGERAVLDYADTHPEWRTELIRLAQSILAQPEETV